MAEHKTEQENNLKNLGGEGDVAGFGDRISAVSRQIGSRLGAAQAAGVSADSLQRYIRGEVHPSFMAMARLAEAAGVSLEWLATGQGTMERAPAGIEPTGPGQELVVFRYLAPPGGGESPAGAALNREWMERLGMNPARLMLFPVAGDSMAPTLMEGDLIFVDTADVEPAEGLFVLRMGERLVVKRLQLLPGGMLEAVSDNSRYRPVEIDGARSAALAGRVVLALRRV
ncbi:MAG: helix-turn-helix domain-containing protein [Deltaproteobacteria bacterium]|nr:helix-turn-helix domain-containing protein [Deltaproteobacteria bacterium]